MNERATAAAPSTLSRLTHTRARRWIAEHARERAIPFRERTTRVWLQQCNDTHPSQACIDMKYICDGPNKTTWFRIETEVEAERESELMGHAVAKHFATAREAAVRTFKSSSSVKFEQLIGLEAHVQRTMPLFLTLRDAEGEGLATAMLPPDGRDDPTFQTIIVGKNNADPYSDHAPAIAALGAHFGLSLDRERSFPYRR